MDSPFAIAQLVVVALLGAEYVVLALWYQTPLEDRYREWREDTTTHTTLGKLL